MRLRLINSGSALLPSDALSPSRSVECGFHIAKVEVRLASHHRDNTSQGIAMPLTPNSLVRGSQVDLVICFDACASPGRSIQVGTIMLSGLLAASTRARALCLVACLV